MSKARILGDRDVLVQVGSDINLTCRAEESPEAPSTVTWYKNDIRVDNLLVRGGISVVTESRRRSSNLLVSKVTKEDAGNYTCAPTNARADSVMVHVIDGELTYQCPRLCSPFFVILVLVFLSKLCSTFNLTPPPWHRMEKSNLHLLFHDFLASA